VISDFGPAVVRIVVLTPVVTWLIGRGLPRIALFAVITRPDHRCWTSGLRRPSIGYARFWPIGWPVRTGW